MRVAMKDLVPVGPAEKVGRVWAVTVARHDGVDFGDGNTCVTFRSKAEAVAFAELADRTGS